MVSIYGWPQKQARNCFDIVACQELIDEGEVRRLINKNY